MFRLVIASVAAAVLAAPAAAAAWTEGLFEEVNRDFGTVPHGPLLTHPFRLSNPSNQTVHINSLRVSCGCVTASALHSTLAPGQTTVVLAQMDTRRFFNSRTVTIFVLFDQPELYEARLTVTANSHNELAVTPEAAAFGQVPRGSEAEAKVTVSFRGDPNWQVTEVTSQSAFVVPTAVEKARNGAEVTYELTAKLKPGVPVGRWYTDLWLKTNSAGTPRVNVPVQLEVKSLLSVSPGEVQFGAVTAGRPAERKVLVQGPKPFTIKEVRGADGTLVAKPAAGPANKVQVLTLTLTAPQPGAVAKTLKIVTDLPDDNEVDLPAQAVVSGVAAPPAGGAASEPSVAAPTVPVAGPTIP